MGPINNIPTLVQIMAWHRRGHKPLSEPKLVSLLMHICISQPQRVKAAENPVKVIPRKSSQIVFYNSSHDCIDISLYIIVQ